MCGASGKIGLFVTPTVVVAQEVDLESPIVKYRQQKIRNTDNLRYVLAPVSTEERIININVVVAQGSQGYVAKKVRHT